MNSNLTLRSRIAITLVITVFIWAHILWDYFHGGIPTHYLFHDKNMPGIPNWIGAIILPFFTWGLLHRMQRRLDKPNTTETKRKLFLRFLAAAGVAMGIAICFSLGIEIPGFVLLAILGLGFIFPLYYAEFLLGWVLGSAFTFGAVIPIGFGSIFALICFMLYQIGRLLRKRLFHKS
ncbi:MAG: hypothetical protein AAF554_06315 [Bacteroidota bacterium]